jgi:monothiol glutaredoxin
LKFSNEKGDLQMNESTRQRIETLLDQNPVTLFMKGTPQFPMCGFSARAAAILKELQVDFHAVDVLEDPEIREGIKVYGNWPTIPQLYVNKQLIGGSDIMMEMYQAGELQELFSKK